MVHLFCIYSHDKHLTRKVGLMSAGSRRFGCGRLIWGGRVNLRCRTSCSSFVLARLIASFSVHGFNIWIPSAISDFNPLIKVPTNTFWVHPWTQLPNFSNSCWYSRRDPTCRMCERASSKSSPFVGPNQAHSSSSNTAHVTSLISSWNVQFNHLHHWLASPFRWNDAKITFCAFAMVWNSKNWSTRANHTVGLPFGNLGNSSLAILEDTTKQGLSLLSLWERECASCSWVSWLVLSLLEKNISGIRLSVASSWLNLSAIPNSIRCMPSCSPPSPASRLSIHSLLVDMIITRLWY